MLKEKLPPLEEEREQLTVKVNAKVKENGKVKGTSWQVGRSPTK